VHFFFWTLIQVVWEIIIYTKDGVAVKAEGGSIYKAKYAIVSVSVGVLQTDLIDFRPKLRVSMILEFIYFFPFLIERFSVSTQQVIQINFHCSLFWIFYIYIYIYIVFVHKKCFWTFSYEIDIYIAFIHMYYFLIFFNEITIYINYIHIKCFLIFSCEMVIYSLHLYEIFPNFFM
jgi:hypothetical protein